MHKYASKCINNEYFYQLDGNTENAANKLNQVNICFSAYSVLNLKNITNFAVADRLAEAPV